MSNNCKHYLYQRIVFNKSYLCQKKIIKLKFIIVTVIYLHGYILYKLTKIMKKIFNIKIIFSIFFVIINNNKVKNKINNKHRHIILKYACIILYKYIIYSNI